jgi:hypothetical protein
MEQPTPATLGQIINGLGCDATIEEGDLVAAAVVVLKIVEPDGTVRLSTTWSDGLGWIERLGMLRAAERVELPKESEALDD